MASVADPERQQSSIKRYIGASGSRGRDALARQNVGQTNARSQDIHPDLLWLGGSLIGRHAPAGAIRAVTVWLSVGITLAFFARAYL